MNKILLIIFSFLMTLALGAEVLCDRTVTPKEKAVDQLVDLSCKIKVDPKERYSELNCNQYKMCHDSAQTGTKKETRTDAELKAEMLKIHGKKLMKLYKDNFIKYEILRLRSEKSHATLFCGSKLETGDLFSSKEKSDKDYQCNPRLANANSWAPPQELAKYKETAKAYVKANKESSLDRLKKYVLNNKKIDYQHLFDLLYSNDPLDPYSDSYQDNNSYKKKSKDPIPQLESLVIAMNSAIGFPDLRKSGLDLFIKDTNTMLEDHRCTSEVPDLFSICEHVTNVASNILDPKLTLPQINELYADEKEDNLEINFNRCKAFGIIFSSENIIVPPAPSARDSGVELVIIGSEKDPPPKPYLSLATRGCGSLHSNLGNVESYRWNDSDSEAPSINMIDLKSSTEKVQVTAVPDENCKFVGWEHDGPCQGTNPSCNFETKKTDTYVAAVFARNVDRPADGTGIKLGQITNRSNSSAIKIDSATSDKLRPDKSAGTEAFVADTHPAFNLQITIRGCGSLSGSGLSRNFINSYACDSHNANSIIAFDTLKIKLGTQISLNPQAAAHSVFKSFFSYSVCNSPGLKECSFVMNGDVSLTVTFGPDDIDPALASAPINRIESTRSTASIPSKTTIVTPPVLQEKPTAEIAKPDPAVATSNVEAKADIKTGAELSAVPLAIKKGVPPTENNNQASSGKQANGAPVAPATNYNYDNSSTASARYDSNSGHTASTKSANTATDTSPTARDNSASVRNTQQSAELDAVKAQLREAENAKTDAEKKLLQQEIDNLKKEKASITSDGRPLKNEAASIKEKVSKAEAQTQAPVQAQVQAQAQSAEQATSSESFVPAPQNTDAGKRATAAVASSSSASRGPASSGSSKGVAGGNSAEAANTSAAGTGIALVQLDAVDPKIDVNPGPKTDEYTLGLLSDLVSRDTHRSPDKAYTIKGKDGVEAIFIPSIDPASGKVTLVTVMAKKVQKVVQKKSETTRKPTSGPPPVTPVKREFFKSDLDKVIP
jgi:hypothetical protein